MRPNRKWAFLFIVVLLVPCSAAAQTIEGIQVDEGGSVGVGLSSPLEDLHLGATSGHNTIRLGRASYVQESDGRRRLFLGANVYDDENDSWSRQSSTHGASAVDLIAEDGELGSYLRFLVDDGGDSFPSERMRITSSGNVGIGTTSPSAPLHAMQGIRVEHRTNGRAILLEGNGEIETPSGWLHLNRDQDYQVRVGHDSNADLSVANNVGIGTRSPSNRLDVNGTISATSVQETSARRFKTDIEPLRNATALVQALQGVRYQWKESGEPDLGFVAEEVQEVLPELVSRTESGEAKGLNYSHITAVLAEALKEQTQRSDRYEARTQRQERRLEEQANRLKQQQRRIEEQAARLGRQQRQIEAMKEQLETLQKHLESKRD